MIKGEAGPGEVIDATRLSPSVARADPALCWMPGSHPQGRAGSRGPVMPTLIHVSPKSLE